MNNDAKSFRARSQARFSVFALTITLGTALILTSGCAPKTAPTQSSDAEAPEHANDVETPSEDSRTEETPKEQNDPFAQTEPGARAVVNYNGVEFAFRYCPAGSFTLGSPEDESGRENDETQREVTIACGFWIGETETTQEQWNAIGVKTEKEPSHKGAKFPIEYVNWNECDAFVKKLNELGVAPDGWNFGFPTEEQWEYACRAGTTGADYGVPMKDCAWNLEFVETTPERVGTCEVGRKTPNNWGLYDMLGNVSEWTNSRFDDSDWLVTRGGNWSDDASLCRPAARFPGSLTSAEYNLGFRPVLNPVRTE